MPATVTGAKVITTDLAPHLTASKINTLMNTAVENLKISDLKFLEDALNRIAASADPSKTLGQVLL